MKKQSPFWNIALVYYVLANLIAIVPLIAVGVIAAKLSGGTWERLVYTLILNIPITILALKLSAKNIARNYLVTDPQKILSWAIGYLIVLNFIFLVVSFLKTGYDSGIILRGALIVLEAAVLYYIFTPKFLKASPKEEVASSTSVIQKETGGQIGKRILKTALLTIGGFILLIIILAILVRMT